MHFPVMVAETLEYLAIRPHGTYVDATAGLGGHTAEIAERLTTGFVIAADRDEQSLAIAREKTRSLHDRIRFVHSRFSELAAAVARTGAERVDGLLADLGVNRYQLTAPERGFSLKSDGPLDMRMDSGGNTTTAADIVNYVPEGELADLLFYFGDERRSRRIARAIVRARPIRSTLHLADVVESVVPRTGLIHPATRTFMALRISVNGEGQELQTLLESAPGMLRAGSRFVVLTFMSSEDRVVKHAFQAWGREGRAKILTKHVVPPSRDEVRLNPPSRSAKLRAVEMA